MFGNFQQSELRLEVRATAAQLEEFLTSSTRLQQWLWPQRLSAGMPERLSPGVQFTSWLGPIPVHHQVEVVSDRSLRLLLSQGIDGHHEWLWGEGWLQSRLEGISLLPLNLGQTSSLWRLQQALARA